MEKHEVQNIVNSAINELTGQIQRDLLELNSICAVQDILLQIIYSQEFKRDTPAFNNAMSRVKGHAESGMASAHSEIDAYLNSRHLVHIERFRQSVLERIEAINQQ